MLLKHNILRIENYYLWQEFLLTVLQMRKSTKWLISKFYHLLLNLQSSIFLLKILMESMMLLALIHKDLYYFMLILNIGIQLKKKISLIEHLIFLLKILLDLLIVLPKLIMKPMMEFFKLKINQKLKLKLNEKINLKE